MKMQLRISARAVNALGWLDNYDGPYERDSAAYNEVRLACFEATTCGPCVQVYISPEAAIEFAEAAEFYAENISFNSRLDADDRARIRACRKAAENIREKIRAAKETGMKMECPGTYEDAAVAAQNAGNWTEAERLWRKAAGCTIGHNRRNSYTLAAERCRSEAKATAAPTA